MKTTGKATLILLTTLGLMISGCASPVNAPVPTELADSTLAPTVEAAEETATPRPTQGPTATVWPPVFDLFSLRDIRELDSFVVTVNEKNTVNGQLTELTATIGYVKEPYGAYYLNEYYSGMDRTYAVDGRTYSVTGSGDWYLKTGTNDDIFYKVDIPAGNTEKLVDAQFAGQEEYQGIPAYHFVLEKTESYANTVLEGDFYLAQDGNYVLYSHWAETTTQGGFKQVYEVTESLSTINQLTEITLPPDLQDMKTAMDLPQELGLPLPPDSTLFGMIRYKFGIGIDDYTFNTPKTSIDEFLDYYRGLEPTEGWTVSHVGHVSIHKNDCEFSRECVIINKGSTQVILYYNGATIRAEFDWPHLFSPL
ncbi:MAG: hypothetical protein M1608_07620 [Candidatus Omnitrophica bacterium]|nr:hypothetical protein [Candidatus Omnitrophota bacterium]